MKAQYKYTLTLRGFQTMQREAAHPFKGYEGGLSNIMKKAYWVNVTRGNKTIKRIKKVYLLSSAIKNKLSSLSC